MLSYLDHIAACNRRNLTLFLPLMVDGKAAGWVRKAHVPWMTGADDPFQEKHGFIDFKGEFSTVAQRTDAIGALMARLVAEEKVMPARGETYAARISFLAPEMFRLDRRFCRILGLRQYGVHVNGFVRKDGGIHVWIGTRSKDLQVCPGQLDNIVAGGQPADLSLMENLVKEAEEEAGIPEELARQATPVSTISYAFEEAEGLHVSTLFNYDLELPESFTPANTDGEMTGFDLLPIDQVLSDIREADRYKFNVNLVIIDFALRHGLLNPDDWPSFEALDRGLRQHP